jgi:hypothetical protein
MLSCTIRKIEAVNRRAGVFEQRGARRFKVGWEAAVKGTDAAGASFGETARLENLSSYGAFLYLKRLVSVGARLELRIRVPFKKESWMRYSAEVVRVEDGAAEVGVAMRFESARPRFDDR